MNFEERQDSYKKLNENVVRDLYQIQKRYLLSGIEEKKEAINLIASLFKDYTRTDALKLIDQKLNQDKTVLTNENYHDIEKAMDRLKKKSSGGVKKINNRIKDLNLLTTAIDLVTKETGGQVGQSTKNYLTKLRQAADQLEIIKKSMSGKNDKADFTNVIEDIGNSFSEVKGFFGEYLALAFAKEKISSLPKNISHQITVINLGKESIKTGIRMDKQGQILKNESMRESRDLVFKVGEKNAKIELGMTIKNYSNYWIMKKYGISLRSSSFASVLPALAGIDVQKFGISQNSFILSAFTFGFHGLKYSWLEESDLENIRKLTATILFTTTYSQNDLTRALQLSIINDTFKTIIQNNGFFPSLEKMVLNQGNLSQKELLKIPPSDNIESELAYLARYVGLQLKLKLLM